MTVEIGEQAGVLRFSVHVQPRAASNQIVGSYDGALKIRLTAPPLEERANRQLIQFLAQCLGLPAGNVSLSKGHRSRRKTLTIQGLSKNELNHRITQYLV
ncbi:MAG: DUF167 domain-containing protein [Acidobacteriota bacterium]